VVCAVVDVPAVLRLLCLIWELNRASAILHSYWYEYHQRHAPFSTTALDTALKLMNAVAFTVPELSIKQVVVATHKTAAAVMGSARHPFKQ
jgi:2-methylcitrate dehydratase PrpD